MSSVFTSEVIHASITRRVLVNAQVLSVATHQPARLEYAIQLFKQEGILLEKVLMRLIVTHIVDVVGIGKQGAEGGGKK